jgi:hypothetical protein
MCDMSSREVQPFRFKAILFVSLALFSAAGSADWVENFNEDADALNRRLLFTEDPNKGLVIDNLTASAIIAVWGFNNWNWGSESFHVTNEDWFDYESDTGGSDKTGHFYMTYLLSRVLSSRMEDRGWDLHEASLAGSLSGILAMTLLEIGDGTSEYGFSKEDLIADSLGALTAYAIRTNPEVDKFLDVRMEYWPSSGYQDNADTATDYSGMKHLVAFKLSGFDRLKKSPWRFVEFQAGYYARGYRSYDDEDDKSQQVYVGVGLSLAALADESGINVLKNLFEFYQPGGTYVETNVWER